MDDDSKTLYLSDENSDSDDELLGIRKVDKKSYRNPTMEVINNKYERARGQRNCQLDNINKYQRMKEIRDITGFIVNVHDATNFDIDLDISLELHEKYQNVISNQYTYQDLDDNFLENPEMNRLEIKPEIGTTYRCRLRGIGINQLGTMEHTLKSNQMCIDVKQLIDRSDGWVICTLSDIDVYKRLLVDINIQTSNGSINLRDYLLYKMKDEPNPLFYQYSGKKYVNGKRDYY